MEISIEVGNRLREIRKSRGLTQENMCKVFKVATGSAISKYESGKEDPSLIQILRFCKETGITITEFVSDNVSEISTRNNKNPFNTKKLYIYYKGYLPTSRKSRYLTFEINIEYLDDYTSAILKDAKTGKIYSEGFLNSNDLMAIFDFRNHEPNSLALSMGVATIGIGSHMNGIYKGNLVATNDFCIPSCRKCLVSKEYLEWTDTMKEEIKYTDEEIEEFRDTDILTTGINAKEDYELN